MTKKRAPTEPKIRVLSSPPSVILAAVNPDTPLTETDGRDFTKVKNLNDLVRYYDGNKNPIGKAYSKDHYENMLIRAGFKNIEFQYFFFPFRFLKLKLPKFFKTFLLKFFPFMIVANLKK